MSQETQIPRLILLSSFGYNFFASLCFEHYVSAS